MTRQPMEALELAREALRAMYPLTEVGGGPWRVLPECGAYRHNTAKAAKMHNPVRCICPRALARMKEQHMRRNEARRTSNMARSSVNGLPGGGPWLIKATCPGLLHNTLNAATKGARELRCICPHGQALKQDMLDKLSAKRATKATAVNAAAGRGSAPTYIANVRGDAGPFPSLPTGGACQSARGMEIVDAYWDERNGSTMAHRAMCERCPLREKCAAMVLKFETPAGAWGGMYAGMDVADRRRVAQEIMKRRLMTEVA